MPTKEDRCPTTIATPSTVPHHNLQHTRSKHIMPPRGRRTQRHHRSHFRHRYTTMEHTNPRHSTLHVTKPQHCSATLQPHTPQRHIIHTTPRYMFTAIHHRTGKHATPHYHTTTPPLPQYPPPLIPPATSTPLCQCLLFCLHTKHLPRKS